MLGTVVGVVAGFESGLLLALYVTAGILVGVLSGFAIEFLHEKAGDVSPGWIYGVALLIGVSVGIWRSQSGLETAIIDGTLSFAFGIPLGLLIGWVADRV